MCTLILYYRCRDDWPLLVAGNRDERLDRPAQAPRALPGKLRRWAGIDKEANGTWLGLNAAGTIVGLTNAARSMRDSSLRSRGKLVLDILKEPSATAAAEALSDIEDSTYNPFQIIVADARYAFLGTFDTTMRVEPLPEGVHVLTNAAPGDPEEPRRAEVLRLLGVEGPPEGKSVEDLQRILSRHAPVPERSVCLHRPVFGTRSASLIGIGGKRAPLYLHAEGPPCRTPFRDLSPRRSEFKTTAPSGGKLRAAARNRRSPAAKPTTKKRAPRSRRIHA
ncbi:MAG: NRDE family protein [Acidobacteriota bacterium]|nr:NRDE family protein [Acidobacteriota bacterium]